MAASLLAAMDRTVAPCVDFFQYACGTWNRLHVIPEDRSAISTFEILADQLQVILKRVLEEPPNANDNNATLKAKMFYRSCMDIPRIREIGDAPLKKILERLGGWPAVVGTSWRPPPYPLEVLLGRLRGEYNVGVLMEQWVGPDDKNSSVNILQ
ncbi:Membrane metallo-endopeptidase-like protein, partial [Temnothorax longispinosus]